MMRLTALLAALLLMLSACGGEDTQPLPDLTPVNTAAEGFNDESLRAVSFLLNVRKAEEEESLVFTQGNASYRTEYPVAMSGRMTQIYRGRGITADIFYKAGAYYRSDNSSKYYLVMDKEVLLSQFICGALPTVKDSTVSSAKTAVTSLGTKYTLSVESDIKLLTSLFGETLYSSCGLKKPNRNKTGFKDTVYTYVVGEDGTFKSFKLETRVTLYETPNYYPNYQVPESSLIKEFDLSYELTVTDTGDSVKIVTPKTEDYVFLS